MLIKSYGCYWNPDIIDWKKNELLGEIRIKRKLQQIDFWNAQGIYVLHHEFKPIYVGKATRSIGTRLKAHLSDRLAGRWDMFSWFSLSSPKKSNNGVTVAGKRQLGPEIVIDTLEALGILVADPSLNRRREKLDDAHEATQVKGTPKSIRSYLEEISEKLDNNN